MCCVGCLEVARTILANGLGAYYLHRTEPAMNQPAGVPEFLRELPLYDDPRIHADLVNRDSDTCEAALLIDGLVCPACVWLNEQTALKVPGVLDFNLNYATRRAQVRWDAGRTSLSRILAAIAAIGYLARPYDAGSAERSRVREQRALLKRAAVAGLAMMQVMMYAIPAYLSGDGEMTDDIAELMRIASLVLTVPVVSYSALPFFSGALRAIHARQVGMDIPIAIGIAVAFVASTYATLARTGEVYFDSITMFVFLLLAARYLESIGRTRAGRLTEALAHRAPETAIRLPGSSTCSTMTRSGRGGRTRWWRRVAIGVRL